MPQMIEDVKISETKMTRHGLFSPHWDIPVLNGGSTAAFWRPSKLSLVINTLVHAPTCAWKCSKGLQRVTQHCLGISGGILMRLNHPERVCWCIGNQVAIKAVTDTQTQTIQQDCVISHPDLLYNVSLVSVKYSEIFTVFISLL